MSSGSNYHRLRAHAHSGAKRIRVPSDFDNFATSMLTIIGFPRRCPPLYITHNREDGDRGERERDGDGDMHTQRRHFCGEHRHRRWRQRATRTVEIVPTTTTMTISSIPPLGNNTLSFVCLVSQFRKLQLCATFFSVQKGTHNFFFRRNVLPRHLKCLLLLLLRQRFSNAKGEQQK